MEGEKREKPFNTRLMSKGSPAPQQELGGGCSASVSLQHHPALAGLEGTGDARGDSSRWDSSLLEEKKGSDPGRRRVEVSGDTHAVTLGTGGTAGTLGSGGTAGTGEAGSASNARSTLEEADEAVRKQHGPSSQSQEEAGGQGTLTVAPLAPG